ncbi:MAG TPA: pentapeptide repeat-containing protein [Candidatus Acidoferrales bacterium]|nr:pentapeptide repeat-containing protein [Candidatus Acidoferrales bacterium]
MKSLFRFRNSTEGAEKLSADAPENPLEHDAVASAVSEDDTAESEVSRSSDTVPLDSRSAAEIEVNAAGAPLNFLCRKFGNLEFEDVLEQHRRWIDSDGRAGKRADLSGANFESADMIGAELAGANLFRANFQGADLLMANFRGACLVEADLREATLVGANFRETSLAGARLETSTGLLAPQLAGANLLGAMMPDTVSLGDELVQVASVSRNVRKLLAAVALACAIAWVILLRTTDAQLLSNAPILAIPRAGYLMPLGAFYLVGPIFLLGLYIGVHMALQRVWDVLAEVPAVFPDGKRLEDNMPRFVMALARSQLNWLTFKRSPAFILESLLSTALAYWLIPATMLLFWARYLTVQDFRGTLLQITLLMVVAMIARALQTRANGLPSRAQKRPNILLRFLRSVRNASPTAMTIVSGLALLLLSLGAIRGLPHNSSRGQGWSSRDYRSWAANAFWLIGYDPFANISQASLSTPPPGGLASADDVKKVQGARLEDASLRYAQAYGVFLANARMRGADLQGATLSEADLRGANLREANLEGALLDRAQMSHTNLTLAQLDGAKMSRADLTGADLTSALLTDAVLVDAHMDGANLYGAQLGQSRLARASMQKADLRGAHLDGAEMSRADLRGAYIGSAKLGGARLENALLGGAFLDDADFRNADFTGASLTGAILSGTDFTGAKLAGADFRGALQVTAVQICAAGDRRGILLDDALQAQVVARCGAVQ